MAGNLGRTKTWKITYHPKVPNNTHQWAMYTFQQLYAGQYFTIAKCEELFK